MSRPARHSHRIEFPEVQEFETDKCPEPTNPDTVRAGRVQEPWGVRRPWLFSYYWCTLMGAFLALPGLIIAPRFATGFFVFMVVVLPPFFRIAFGVAQWKYENAASETR